MIQQYKVISDRDRGDDPIYEDTLPTDRVVVEGYGADERIIRIERPLSKEEQTPTAEPSTSDRWASLAQDITAGNTDALKERLRELPGYTNFTADTWPGAFPVRWRKEPDGWFSRIVNGGRSYFPGPEFDPSTIRDVTPPKEA